MGAKERERIKEYLTERLRATGRFQRVEPNFALNPKDPERARNVLAEAGNERYLLMVHSDPQLKPNQKSLLGRQQKYSAAGIATVSVFDDSVFYNWDRGPFKASRLGTHAQRSSLIKLLGLELVAQSLGPVAYFKNDGEKMQVVRYKGGVVANYESSENDFAREQVRQQELKTVMQADVVETLDSFDMFSQKRGDYLLAGFKRHIPLIPVADKKESSGQRLDDRLQYLVDEMDGGNEEIPHQLTGADREALRKQGYRVA